MWRDVVGADGEGGAPVSAETLREAARLMRAGEGWPLDADGFALAVADWLEARSGVAYSEDVQGFGPGISTRAALAVARAYLGVTP